MLLIVMVIEHLASRVLELVVSEGDVDFIKYLVKKQSIHVDGKSYSSLFA